MSTTLGQAGMEDVFSEEGQAGNPLGEALLALAHRDEEVVVLSVDLSTAIASLRKTYPQRCFEMGIAENNTVSVAAGLATVGYRPYILGLAPFGMLKCAEQIRTDLAATNLPVRLIERLSGLAMGYFGPSHHAIEDIAIARSITNLVVTAAADNTAVRGLLDSTFDIPGPVLVRVSEATETVYEEVPRFEFGRFHKLLSGTDLTIIGCGGGVGLALRAAELLRGEGHSVAVWDAAYLKPLDEEAILEAARETGAILTVEEHSEVGGLGAAVAEVLGRKGVLAKLDVLALPDERLEVGQPAALMEHYDLTTAGVRSRALRLLGTP